MGIFKDMYEQRRFNTDWEYRELRRMLTEAIERGYVEKIPVMKPHRLDPDHLDLDEEWYRDKETGEIYSLSPPEEKIRGHWIKVDPEDLMKPGETVQ